MRLAALLAGLPPERSTLRIEGEHADDTPIRGIAIDSRAVVPGDLFVALRGAQSDGHRYLEAAIDSGASALLVEQPPEARAIQYGKLRDLADGLAVLLMQRRECTPHRHRHAEFAQRTREI